MTVRRGRMLLNIEKWWWCITPSPPYITSLSSSPSCIIYLQQSPWERVDYYSCTHIPVDTPHYHQLTTWCGGRNTQSSAGCTIIPLIHSSCIIGERERERDEAGTKGSEAGTKGSEQSPSPPRFVGWKCGGSYVAAETLTVQQHHRPSNSFFLHYWRERERERERWSRY